MTSIDSYDVAGFEMGQLVRQGVGKYRKFCPQHQGVVDSCIADPLARIWSEGSSSSRQDCIVEVVMISETKSVETL